MKRKKDNFITVNHLTVRYGDFLALNDVSFSIPKGDIVAIIGPNGSGKTSLVKQILGLENPTEGSILIDGKSVHESLRRMGYVPQRFFFDKTLPLTVFEFLQLSLCEKKRHAQRDAIEDVLALVGMNTGIDKKQLGVLSGGQLQRILIARALLHERDILILDEPSTGIDASGEQALYDLIHHINKTKNTTFVIVSHELDFVSKFADSVVCVQNKLVCHDTPEKAFHCLGVQELYAGHTHVHTVNKKHTL